ncbi:hypothetical protein BH24BAC1_BH24BAC1_16910 [soil metagenome]
MSLYGWQFPGGQVRVSARKGYRLNLWGMISRQSECIWSATTNSVNAEFVLQELDMLSLSVHGPTFVVLDKASVHRAKVMGKEPGFGKAGVCTCFSCPLTRPTLTLPKRCGHTLRGMVKSRRLP